MLSTTNTALTKLAERVSRVAPAWHAALADELSIQRAPRFAQLDRSPEYELGVEAIREGWLLHRSASRIAPTATREIAILMGDWCYAEGLCEVTAHGSLDDIEVLAQLVADVSARGDEPIEQLEPRWTRALAALRATGDTPKT
jgi:hypothetical protein